MKKKIAIFICKMLNVDIFKHRVIKNNENIVEIIVQQKFLITHRNDKQEVAKELREELLKKLEPFISIDNYTDDYSRESVVRIKLSVQKK